MTAQQMLRKHSEECGECRSIERTGHGVSGADFCSIYTALHLMLHQFISDKEN